MNEQTNERRELMNEMKRMNENIITQNVINFNDNLSSLIVNWIDQEPVSANLFDSFLSAMLLLLRCVYAEKKQNNQQRGK